MWSLKAAPNGFRTDDHGSVSLFLQLMALPQNMSSIEIERKLECVNKGIVKTKISKTPFGYPGGNMRMRQHSGWGPNVLKLEDLLDLNEVHFRATVKIIGYTSNDGAYMSPNHYIESDEETESEDIDINQISSINSKLCARPFESRSKRTFFETNARR